MSEQTWRTEPHFLCCDCDTVTTTSALLTEPHPFSLDDEQVHGCPACREMDLVRACDVTDCGYQASLGNPSPDGYHWLCYPHRDLVGGR